MKTLTSIIATLIGATIGTTLGNYIGIKMVERKQHGHKHNVNK